MDDVLASSSDDEGAAPAQAPRRAAAESGDADDDGAADASARKPSRKEPVSQQSSDEDDFDAKFPARKGAKPPPRRRRAGAESSDDDEEAERPPPRKRPKPEREDAPAVVKKRLGLKSAADVADAHAYCRAVLSEDAAPEAALAKLALGAAFIDRRFAPVEKKQRDHQRRRHAKQGQATETPKQEARRVAAETRAAFSEWTASRLLVELLAWARGVDDGGRRAAACLLGLCRIDLHALCETNIFELLAKAVLSWEAFRFALDEAQRAEGTQRAQRAQRLERRQEIHEADDGHKHDEKVEPVPAVPQVGALVAADETQRHDLQQHLNREHHQERERRRVVRAVAPRARRHGLVGIRSMHGVVTCPSCPR